ncbi:MAG: hypothetical protein QM802_23110 [Agriterribacter sp.]
MQYEIADQILTRLVSTNGYVSRAAFSNGNTAAFDEAVEFLRKLLPGYVEVKQVVSGGSDYSLYVDDYYKDHITNILSNGGTSNYREMIKHMQAQEFRAILQGDNLEYAMVYAKRADRNSGWAIIIAILALGVAGTAAILQYFK